MSDGNFARPRGTLHPGPVAAAAAVGAALASTAAYLGPPHVLTAWPLLVFHGAAGGIIAALLVEWLALLFRTNRVPNDPNAQREWAGAILGHCGDLFGRRAVLDDSAGSVIRLVALVRAQLVDRWSLYAICGFLLGMGWMGIYLLGGDGPVPTEQVHHLLVLGFVQSVAVLTGAAILWMAGSKRLRDWEWAALRAVAAASVVEDPSRALPNEEVRPQSPPKPQSPQVTVTEPIRAPVTTTKPNAPTDGNDNDDELVPMEGK